MLAAAGWVREPRVPYLVLAGVATAACVALMARGRSRAGWAAAGLVLAAALAVLLPAARTQRVLGALDRNGEATLAARRELAARALQEEVNRQAESARATARAALGAVAGLPDDPSGEERAAERARAFAAVGALAAEAPERAVVALRRGVPLAWGGVLRVHPDSVPRELGVSVAPLWTVLHATAASGRDRAVVTVLLHAAPPAESLAVPLDRGLSARFGARGFEFATAETVAEQAAARTAAGLPPVPPDSAWRSITVGGALTVLARPLMPSLGEARLRTVDDARRRAAPALLALTLVLVVAAWRRPTSLARRLLVLAVPLGAVAAGALAGLSNASRLFDSSLYVVDVGRAFTGSIGALGITCLVVLLGLFAVLRAGWTLPSRGAATAAVLVLAALAPFLLRRLSRGITPPALGVPVSLWVAWQVTLFLAAAVLLFAAAVVGRSAVAPGRGLHPAVAPAIAGAAALAGPLLWSATAGWPAWYTAVWIVVVGALAFTRRTKALLVGAAAVAGLGSATLVWSTTARARVAQAERDVAGLAVPDPVALGLLERFGRSLGGDAALRPRPFSPGGLLRRYASSPLGAVGFPVALAGWAPPEQGDTVVSRVATATWSVDSASLRAAVAVARAGGAPVVRVVAAEPGVAPVLAVPHPGGWVTTVTVFPRTGLLPEEPIAPLLGLARPLGGDPPYALSRLGRVARPDASPARAAEAAGMATTGPRWERRGAEVHGDWLVPLPDAWTRVHAEIALRPLGPLVQRGALLVLLDLAVVGALWLLPALADGAGPRWLRWWRRASRRSFRARLTLALFGFFAVPTTAFALWSYGQLQSGDRQSRELLVYETLRATTPAETESPAALRALAARLGTPLLVYEDGILVRSSDPGIVALAPFGRMLPAAQMRTVGVGAEAIDSDELRIGGATALVGFRASLVSPERSLVVAAPARADAVALDRRRRDLGFLVALAAMGGALAALGLSGVAARELSRPVGALREAALAIAGEERGAERLPAVEPVAAEVAPPAPVRAALAERPPAEFRPVFAAFRRMATDLAASRAALEAARRRTAAVLRDVASGVVAVDAAGRVTLANPRAEALLERALPPGAALDALAPAGLAARVRAYLAGGALGTAASAAGADGRGGNEASGSAAGAAPAEEEFELEAHGRQLRARVTPLAGGQGGAVLTLDDLTELTRAQRVLAWGEMARQVAHEIKNPLTPIRLGVQHLRRAFRDGRVDFGDILERNVERVLDEIDRLDEIARAFSRYGTAPERQAPAEPVDVAAIARDVVALERLGQGSVTWDLAGAEAPAPAWARDGELREVLLNLLENARLARAARVRVHVAREDGQVVLRVADDGHGIAAEALPRIFEPHFSTRTSGSGLGLAISRRLVEAWGGTIGAASVEGAGATLTLTLRAADAERA